MAIPDVSSARIDLPALSHKMLFFTPLAAYAGEQADAPEKEEPKKEEPAKPEKEQNPESES